MQGIINTTYTRFGSFFISPSFHSLIINLLLHTNLYFVVDSVLVPARANEFGVTPDVAVIVEQIVVLWIVIRKVLLPTLQVIVMLCMMMSVIVLVEKAFLGLASGYAKAFRRRPERIYKCDPIVEEEDKEFGSLAYPMVLVQIPMYNEKEVPTICLLKIEIIHTLIMCLRENISLLGDKSFRSLQYCIDTIFDTLK